MLTSRLIDRLEAYTGEEMDYARDIADASPSGFWKFLCSSPLLAHTGAVPAHLSHLARIGSLLVEDCGPCVRIALNLARRDDVPAELLRAAIAGGENLPPTERDAYRFGRGVAAGEPIDDALRERLRAVVGDRGIADLTLAAAAVRIYPALKRGLGYAQSCSLVELEV